MRKILNLIYKYFKKLEHKIELSGYDRFTICEYFRKQGAQIGEGCSIVPRRLGAEPYLVKIGNNVTVAQGVKFMTHDGAVWSLRKEIPDIHGFGTIIIEDNCVIGQNAILFLNIRIGKNSIVGAGSVVISDVPENTIVMGVPARPFGSLEKYKEKCIVRWNQQRPPDCIIEEGSNWWNSKHYKENREKLKKHLIRLFWERNIKEQNNP